MLWLETLPPDPSFSHVVTTLIDDRYKKAETEEQKDVIASDIQQLGESKRRFEKDFKKLYR